jgi:N-acetylneuraminate lyase
MKAPKLTAATLKGPWAGVTLSWNEDYSFDEVSFRANLRRLASFDVPGIYTTGSTGEFYALDWPEFQRMVDVFMEEIGPTGKPTQIGCCADDTRDVLRMVEYAAKKGAGGAQIVLPYWMELTEREMLQYFKDVSSAVPELPLIHYNIPRAKRFLTGPDYLRILEVAPNLIGVKFTFAGNNFGTLQHALQLTPNLSYFVAEPYLISCMMLGARGSYSSVVCTNPHFMLKMFALGEARRWEEALEMQGTLVAFFRRLEQVAEEWGLGLMDPVADKGLGVASGLLAGHQRTRPPYIGWSDEGVRKVRAWLKQEYPQLVAPPA